MIAYQNKKHPIGIDVTLINTKARAEAKVLFESMAVIWVEGVAGYYDLVRTIP